MRILILDSLPDVLGDKSRNHQRLETPRIDAISDGKDTFTATVMEHIELAGVHSGDSVCVIPSRTITDENIRIIKEYTAKIGRTRCRRSHEHTVRDSRWEGLHP